ncbi:MAG: FAD-binding oxidoreductase, partial [Mesorhizobium sp.]
YEDTAGPRPEYKALDGDRTCDVVIVGGGFTGLSAAAHLAKAGSNVVLIEAHRFGDGASGRNGGQLGTGQRAWAEELEAEYGFSRAKALFDLAEEAKSHLLEFAAVNKIEIDYMPGQISVAHKQRYVDDYKAHAEIMANRFGYPHIAFMDAKETAERLGSTRYFGGTRDTGTGHIHPLKLVIGTAKVAAQAGAQLFEQTPATGIASLGGKVRVTTAKGTISAEKCPIGVNAHGGTLELYPALKAVEITHGWGGYVGITMPRKPFVREVMANVISVGGYSGHGIMLSNFFGKLYAETVAGNRDRLRLIEDLKIPAFPGGRRFRAPLLFLALNWYALRDRI